MDLALLFPLKTLVERALLVGVDEQLIWLLLSMPTLAAIVAASRQFVGLTGFGLITPIILTVAFVVGGFFTLLTCVLVLLSVTLTRVLLRRFRIRYISRIAIIVSILSLLLFLYVTFGVSLGLSAKAVEFPVLFLLVIYAEIFTNLQINRSYLASIKMALETIAVAIFMALIVGLPTYKEFVLTQPEATVLLSLILIYFSARYTGLRFSELIRFRQLISR